MMVLVEGETISLHCRDSKPEQEFRRRRMWAELMRKLLIGCRILQLLRNAEWADKQKIEQRRRERRCKAKNRISQPDLRCKTSPPKWKNAVRSQEAKWIYRKDCPSQWAEGNLRCNWSQIHLSDLLVLSKGWRGQSCLLLNAPFFKNSILFF